MKKTLIGGFVVATLFGAAAFAADSGALGNGHAPKTKAEMLQKADERFAKMDVNTDGKLDAADRAAKSDQRFEELDTNKDGVISKPEFTAGHAKHHNEDGAVTGDKKMRGKWGRGGRGGHKGARHGDGERGLAMADSNQDKAISRDEFRAAASARFAKADTNADGVVSADERKAMRGMMGRMGKRGPNAAVPAAPATPPAN